MKTTAQKNLAVHWRSSAGSKHRLVWLVFAALLQCAQISAAEANRYLTGQFLVATPAMRDPRFLETVIYMVRHDASGAFGLVINRPIAEISMTDLLKGFGIEREGTEGQIPVHYGGPVSPRQGFVLHSDDYRLDTSTVLNDGTAMTTDPRLIQAIADGKGPRQVLFVLGYAGWAPGQLESEIRGDSWITIPGDQSILFGQDANKKWRRAIDRRKIEL